MDNDSFLLYIKRKVIDGKTHIGVQIRMLKVLVAEDDSFSNIQLKKLLLRWGYDIVAAFDGEEAWQILQQEKAPQIAILDWMMPKMEGLEVCRRLREREKDGARYTYVIMLSARGEKQDIVTGMNMGADDYIVKPFDKEECRARLQAGQRIVEKLEALHVANKRLLLMSRLDPLTGAMSRNAILDDLDMALYRAVREKKSLSVALVDVDSLKEVNSQYGRTAGDLILQASVRRIHSSLRRTDSFGRYGGDEFLVILLGASLDSGQIVCRRIQNTMNEMGVPFNGKTLSVTVSQALAVWDGKAGLGELLDCLERKLADTKDNGENRLEFVESCAPLII
jgi:two-component system, cell cycle response regulator